MKTIALNTLAILIGLILGSAVNIALVNLGPKLIPPPSGADITTMEGLRETMHLFAPKHFLFPFLGHALGTLAGAATALLIARSHKTKIAYAIGGLFFVGGALNCFMLPSPIWFNALDLIFAYLPMAWLAIKFCPSPTPSDR